MLSPGHTLGLVTYICGDAAFVHDTPMCPDSGTSRVDFSGGSTAQLWGSIQMMLALPSETRLFIGHDYGSEGRDQPAWEATVQQHLNENIHVAEGADRDAWVRRRAERDKMLSLPDRMLTAL
jgi:glyoxylase-like metal-dependent hydrolase (beta-lactamase superfamily II)